MFCCVLLYVPSSLAIILMGKRELVALLSLSSWSLLIVVWLFHGVPWVCLQFVIVVFPDHTHLLLFVIKSNILAPNYKGNITSKFIFLLSVLINSIIHTLTLMSESLFILVMCQLKKTATDMLIADSRTFSNFHRHCSNCFLLCAHQLVYQIQTNNVNVC